MNGGKIPHILEMSLQRTAANRKVVHIPLAVKYATSMVLDQKSECIMIMRENMINCHENIFLTKIVFKPCGLVNPLVKTILSDLKESSYFSLIFFFFPQISNICQNSVLPIEFLVTKP